MSWIKDFWLARAWGPGARPGQVGSCDVHVTRSGFQEQPTPALLALWFQLKSWQGSYMLLIRIYRNQAQGMKKLVLTVSDLNPDPETDPQHPISHTHIHTNTHSDTQTLTRLTQRHGHNYNTHLDNRHASKHNATDTQMDASVLLTHTCIQT